MLLPLRIELLFRYAVEPRSELCEFLPVVVAPDAYLVEFAGKREPVCLKFHEMRVRAGGDALYQGAGLVYVGDNASGDIVHGLLRAADVHYPQFLEPVQESVLLSFEENEGVFGH